MTPIEDPPVSPAGRFGPRLTAWLGRPVDIAFLATFRALFGAVLAVSMLRFLVYGWVERFFVEPTFHFKYWGFAWVQPLSGTGMQILFIALGCLAVAISLGFAFRVSAPLFALGLTYFQLIDVSTYLNHYYLAALLAWLLAFSPAHRAWSVDAWIARRLGRPAATRIPAAWLYLLRVQVGIVYVFAGLAKAQGDWLLHGQPLRIWLGASTDLPVIGPLFTLAWTPVLLSWCGFLFDTTIVGWLLYRRTRPYAYAVVIVFHALTRTLFPIGMFPFIMVLAATLFFEPDWPRRAFSWLRRTLKPSAGAPATPPSAGPVAGLGSSRWMARAGVALGLAYCSLQLVLPLRWMFYGGNVLWHEQGMRFSWRVMVRAKGGSTTFLVRDKRSGREYHVHPRAYLTGMQESEMSGQPDLILQLAHHIEKEFARRGLGPVEVHADARVSLNGRRGRPLVDPSVDLVAVRDGLAPAQWVLPAPAQPPPHTKPVL